MRATRGLRVTAVVGLLAVATACGGAAGGADGDGQVTGGGMLMSPSGMDHDGMMGGAVRGDCRAVEGGEVALAAEGLAYDTSCIEAPAGEAFTIAFENRDGAPHNVTIDDASGTTVVDGGNVTQGSIDYEVPALDPGEYPFHCHVHPDMQGVLRVR